MTQVKLKLNLSACQHLTLKSEIIALPCKERGKSRPPNAALPNVADLAVKFWLTACRSCQAMITGLA